MRRALIDLAEDTRFINMQPSKSLYFSEVNEGNNLSTKSLLHIRNQVPWNSYGTSEVKNSLICTDPICNVLSAMTIFPIYHAVTQPPFKDQVRCHILLKLFLNLQTLYTVNLCCTLFTFISDTQFNPFYIIVMFALF